MADDPITDARMRPNNTSANNTCSAHSHSAVERIGHSVDIESYLLLGVYRDILEAQDVATHLSRNSSSKVGTTGHYVCLYPWMPRIRHG